MADVAGCYGYCVLPRGTEAPGDLRGIDDQRVTARSIGELTVWVSQIARPEPLLQLVQQHNRVVEAAVTEQVTPVPLRFGQWSAEASDFDALLVAREAWYLERLHAFAGAMEFGIRVLRPDKQAPARVVRVPPVESGTAYMDSLRAREAAVQSEREEGEQIRIGVTAAVHGLVRDQRADELRTSHGVITIAHLVGRADFESYREAIHAARESFPAFRFLLSGPWVPYSFAV